MRSATMLFKENSPIGKLKGEDRGVVALMQICEIFNNVEKATEEKIYPIV